MRGGLLPQAHVYPAAMRSTPDLLRRRLHLVRKRGRLLAHIQNTRARYNLPEFKRRLAYPANRDGVREHCADPSVRKSIDVNLVLIDQYDGLINDLEVTLWLQAHAVTDVAMESTGVYWKPVYYVLEDAFTCVLANAAHIKQVSGRKTDVQDCVWIAQRLEHGLLRGSFVPPVAIRELRDLARYRKALIGERQREANRLQKILEDAGIKLASVASNVLGQSGRAMLAALTEGTTDPEVLADLYFLSRQHARPLALTLCRS